MNRMINTSHRIPRKTNHLLVDSRNRLMFT